MRRLGRTTASLARFRRQWEQAVAAGQSGFGTDVAAPPHRLDEVQDFGSNPGNLRMFAHVPAHLAPAPALVVVLHGCTQTAAAYDHGAGWSALAEHHGFAVLAPEQQRVNNPNNCFNWFQPEDTRRGAGEALSIRQMVERMVADHGIDRRRIFITGLSAGGAMTAALLATYPDVFAGGAIVAGLPYGSAGSVQEALEVMFQDRSRSGRAWGDLVRAASPHRGSWPRVSIWHGSADATVIPANAREIVKQWTDVHGLSASAPSDEDRVDGFPHRTWRRADGTAVVEEYTITGMAHGTPLAVGSGAVPHGAAGPFLLDVGIASSHHIASFWGLTEAVMPRATEDAPRLQAKIERAPERARPNEREPAEFDLGRSRPHVGAGPAGIDVQAVIAKALKSAGLLRR